jgi:hypothetical protein
MRLDYRSKVERPANVTCSDTADVQSKSPSGSDVRFAAILESSASPYLPKTDAS